MTSLGDFARTENLSRLHGRFPVPILKMTPKYLLLYNFLIGH
jgi:hypothetical protein